MILVLSSLIPVFLIIVTGAVLRWRAFMSEEGWTGLEKATYHVFFPAILAMTLAKANLAGVPVLAMGAALTGSVLAMAAILIMARGALRLGLGVDGPAFTSVFQGATRWNSFVAIATAGAMFGREGLALSAIAVAAMVPVLNILAVVVLQRYAQDRRIVLGPTVKALAVNPFIWSTALGGAVNLSGLPIPDALMRYGDILGAAALASGLLLVGAGLNVRAALRPRAVTYLTSALKLALMPAMAGAAAVALGVSGAALTVAVLCAAMPTASGAYILARQMGGDAPLMAEILTVQTLVAIATIPLVLAVVA